MFKRTVATGLAFSVLVIGLAGCSSPEPINNNEFFIVDEPTGPTSEDLESVKIEPLPETFPADVPTVSDIYAIDSYSVTKDANDSNVWNIILFAEGSTLEEVVSGLTNSGWVQNSEAAAGTDSIVVFSSPDDTYELVIVPSETFGEQSYVYTLREL